MIKIYNNINEFLNNQIDTKLDYELTTDSYLLKVMDEEEQLIVEKGPNSELFVTGSVKLVNELVENMIHLGLKFETYTMSKELSSEFNKCYLAKMAGEFIKLECPIKGYVSMKYCSGLVSSCVLAGGCFWCVGKPYYEYEGLLYVYSGYTGGEEIFPQYEEVKSQKTHHKEAIKLIYDESLITYEEILDIYFETIDPFDDGGQFIDRGESYTAAIFYQNEQMKERILRYIVALEEEYQRKIVVKVLPEQVFYMAEEYHQDFALKNPELMEKELIEAGRKKRIN